MNPRPTTAEDVLPNGQEQAVLDGVAVRKGSVAAFVATARDLALLDRGDPGRRELIEHLRGLAPALRAVGVFDVFTLRSAELRDALAE